MIDQAEIVIIGGGGVARALAQVGKTDLLLLEREPAVAAVTTSQAAGLVGQMRENVDRTRMATARSQAHHR
jgi:glycine/D-amino acid oxidase-like deaminating enzyme